ncbi:MAG: serine hydrolase [Terracidiphilus sp.]
MILPIRSILLQRLSVLLLLGAVSVAPALAQSSTVEKLLSGAMRPDDEVLIFSHSDNLYPSATVARKGPVRSLPRAEKQLDNVHFQIDGKWLDLYDYLACNRVAGLLILKGGKIVFEDYELGAKPEMHWASFSVAKSVSSTLVGIALQQGLLHSLDDPVTTYVPALRGSAYDGVTVRNLLQMASGVRWDESYWDPKSDVSQISAALMAQKPGGVVNYMRSLPRAAAPGSVFNYSTGETYLIGPVIEGATHKPLAAFLSESLWSQLGMESDATWWLESPGGIGLAGAGIGATLRDYARFGLFVQQDGVVDGKRLVPEGWFREAGSAHVVGGKSVDYGFLWWPLPKGDPVHQGAFEAQGIFGQFIYINPKEKLVIVVLCARSKTVGVTGVDDDSFFAAVAHELQ